MIYYLLMNNKCLRREFFLRVYFENMIDVRQHCISKNFKSLSFINKTIIKDKISLDFTKVRDKNL